MLINLIYLLGLTLGEEIIRVNGNSFTQLCLQGHKLLSIKGGCYLSVYYANLNRVNGCTLWCS